jgi:hypothetical protein
MKKDSASCGPRILAVTQRNMSHDCAETRFAASKGAIFYAMNSQVYPDFRLTPDERRQVLLEVEENCPQALDELESVVKHIKEIDKKA